MLGKWEGLNLCSSLMNLPPLLPCNSTSELLATDGVDAIRRGDVKASTFPEWRTNCFIGAANGIGWSEAVWIHPESVFRAALCPGDPVLLETKVRCRGPLE